MWRKNTSPVSGEFERTDRIGDRLCAIFSACRGLLFCNVQAENADVQTILDAPYTDLQIDPHEPDASDKALVCV